LYLQYIQLFQLRLSTRKAEKSNTSAKGCWESLWEFINLLAIPSSLSRSCSTFQLCSWTTLIEIAVYISSLSCGCTPPVVAHRLSHTANLITIYMWLVIYWKMSPSVNLISITFVWRPIHTDTRFDNATRIFSFQKTNKPSTDKKFTRYANEIAKIA
jgi:hypothetical protein